jgi:hypothetical protein
VLSSGQGLFRAAAPSDMQKISTPSRVRSPRFPCPREPRPDGSGSPPGTRSAPLPPTPRRPRPARSAAPCPVRPPAAPPVRPPTVPAPSPGRPRSAPVRPRLSSARFRIGAPRFTYQPRTGPAHLTRSRAGSTAGCGTLVCGHLYDPPAGHRP